MKIAIEVEVEQITDAILEQLAEEDVIKVVRCKDCRSANECQKRVKYTRHEPNVVTVGYSPIEWCSNGERRNG